MIKCAFWLCFENPKASFEFSKGAFVNSNVFFLSVFEAIRYYQQRSASFFRFLEDPFLDPTNNEVEQTAKAFATARKNFLFAKSENGGETAGILTTIVKTAVANCLYPDEYIIRILKNREKVIFDPDGFLPWNPWMREGIEIKR